MNAFSIAAGDFFKLQLTVNHELSVEKDLKKQRFLMTMLGEDMKMLVEDRSPYDPKMTPTPGHHVSCITIK